MINNKIWLKKKKKNSNADENILNLYTGTHNNSINIKTNIDSTDITQHKINNANKKDRHGTLIKDCPDQSQGWKKKKKKKGMNGGMIGDCNNDKTFYDI